MGISDAETDFHDEKVLIVVAKDGISVADTIEIVVLEGRTDPRHVHVVHVDEVESVLQIVWRAVGSGRPVLTTPTIAPGCRKHSPVEFRTVLHVVGQRQLAGGGASPRELARQEWSHHAWECQLGL